MNVSYLDGEINQTTEGNDERVGRLADEMNTFSVFHMLTDETEHNEPFISQNLLCVQHFFKHLLHTLFINLCQNKQEMLYHNIIKLASIVR